MIPWHGPVVSGSVIAIILLLSAGVQLLAARLAVHRCGALGMLLLVASNALLILNLQMASTQLFVLGVA